MIIADFTPSAPIKWLFSQSGQVFGSGFARGFANLLDAALLFDMVSTHSCSNRAYFFVTLFVDNFGFSLESGLRISYLSTE